MVLVLLKDNPMLVCFNRFVIFLIHKFTIFVILTIIYPHPTHGIPKSLSHCNTSSIHILLKQPPSYPPPHFANNYKVRRKISLLKQCAAPGNDGITSIMLRHLSQKALLYLTRLFNHLLHRGYFPNVWKHAKVIPNPKPNKPPTDPTSYRPNSLLSTTGKLFERIITNRLTTLLNQLHLIPDEEFGFRKKHSTVSQLTRITDYITHGFNLHKHTGMASIHLEKSLRHNMDQRATV